MPTYHLNSFSFRHAAVHRHLLSLILRDLALVDAGMRRPVTANNDQASCCDSVTNALLWPVCRTNVLICRRPGDDLPAAQGACAAACQCPWPEAWYCSATLAGMRQRSWRSDRSHSRCHPRRTAQSDPPGRRRTTLCHRSPRGRARVTAAMCSRPCGHYGNRRRTE
jgi:hypothetical protein